MSQVAKALPTTGPAAVTSNRTVAADGRAVSGVAAPAFAPVEEVGALSAAAGYGDSTVLSQGFAQPYAPRGQATSAPPPEDAPFRTTSQVFATLLETGQIAGERRRDGERALPRAVLDRAIGAYQASARINGTVARLRGGSLSRQF